MESESIVIIGNDNKYRRTIIIEYLFTCKDCGEHDLIVKVYLTYVRRTSYSQKCTCGKSDNNLAYERKEEFCQPTIEYYYLDEDHHYCTDASVLEEFEFDEIRKDSCDSKIKQENIYCEDCYDSNKRYYPDLSYHEEYGDKDQEYFVICGNCEREIEFGWSHPDRSGRIWPAESTDFEPQKCWPEQRYIAKWAKRNWLRRDIYSFYPYLFKLFLHFLRMKFL